MRALKPVLAALFGLLVAAPSALATFPGSNGRIATELHEFDRGGELNWELRFVDPSGGNRSSLLRCVRGTYGPPAGSCPHDPSYSPNGERLTFSLDGRLVVAAADGSNLTVLPKLTDLDRDPHWDADGQRIVFTGRRAGATNVFRVDADGTDLRQLTQGGGKAPAVSNGGRIAFTRKRRIYVFDPTGTAPAYIVARGNNPDWTPSGAKVVYDRRGDAYSIRAEPESRRKRVRRRAQVPVVSPDGDRIAFVRRVRDDPTRSRSLRIAPLRGKSKVLLRGGEQPIGSTWNDYSAISWQPR